MSNIKITHKHIENKNGQQQKKNQHKPQIIMFKYRQKGGKKTDSFLYQLTQI